MLAMSPPSPHPPKYLMEFSPLNTGHFQEIQDKI